MLTCLWFEGKRWTFRSQPLLKNTREHTSVFSHLYNNSRHYKPTVITQHWTPTSSTPLSVWPPCAQSSFPSLSTALWPWFTSWLHVIHLLRTAPNCFSFSLPLFRSLLNLIHSPSHSLCLSCYNTLSFIPIWPTPKHSLSLWVSPSLSRPHTCRMQWEMGSMGELIQKWGTAPTAACSASQRDTHIPPPIKVTIF